MWRNDLPKRPLGWRDVGVVGDESRCVLGNSYILKDAGFRNLTGGRV